MAKYWRLEVGLPLSGFNCLEGILDACRRLEHVLMLSACDSGLGFGFRDLGFVFDDKLKAQVTAASAVAFLQDRGMTVDINPTTEADLSNDHAYVQVVEYDET